MFRVLANLFLRGFADLRINKGVQCLTLAAVILVAFLGGLFLIALHNLDMHLDMHKGKVTFQVYWQKDTEPEKVRASWKELQNLPYLNSMHTYTPDQGLDVLSESLSTSINLNWLKGQSPLPPTAVLNFSFSSNKDFTQAKQIYNSLKSRPGIAKVHFNPLQMDMARSWIQFTHRIAWPMIGFLTFILALIVGNTFKLALLYRKEEIEILRLVGAARWYIQLPLLIGGAIQGLAGGMMGFALLKFVQISVQDILNIPPLWIKVHFLPLPEILIALLIITAASSISSWVAIRD